MIFVLVLALIFAGGSIMPLSPVFAGDEIIYISPEKEKRIGESIAGQIDKEYEPAEDPLARKRFEDLGKKLACVCERNNFVYHFKLLRAKKGEPEEKYYNAFALPGGYVYMFEPLFNLLGTDDRIAAVTAHELGHINARHASKRIQGTLGANALMLLAMAVSGDSRTAAEASEAITQLMMAYSREDEFEADRYSVKYMKKAGFNPGGVVESLCALKKMRKNGPVMKYMYYRTHPYLSERIAAARSEVKGYTDFQSYINLSDEKTGL